MCRRDEIHLVRAEALRLSTKIKGFSAIAACWVGLGWSFSATEAHMKFCGAATPLFYVPLRVLSRKKKKKRAGSRIPNFVS